MSKRTMIPLALFQRKVIEITPTIYASFILALHRRCGMEYDDLVEILSETQTIWHESFDNNVDVTQMCYDETDIDIMSSVTAREAKLDGERI